LGKPPFFKNENRCLPLGGGLFFYRQQMGDVDMIARALHIPIKKVRECVDRVSEKIGADKKFVLGVLVEYYSNYSPFFENMPPELIDLILHGASVKDIINFCMTSKAHSGYCDDPHLWRALLFRDFNVTQLQGQILVKGKKLSVQKDPKTVYKAIVALGKQMEKLARSINKASGNTSFLNARWTKFVRILHKISHIGGAVLLVGFLNIIQQQDISPFVYINFINNVFVGLMTEWFRHEDFEILRQLKSQAAEPIVLDLIKEGFMSLVNRVTFVQPNKFKALFDFYVFLFGEYVDDDVRQRMKILLSSLTRFLNAGYVKQNATIVSNYLAGKK
jgi:hypothetical protein